jgi:acetylornithine aminotransferase
VHHVGGFGAWRGIDHTARGGAAVETAARDAGYLVNAPAPDVIRLAPPLVVSDAQLDAFLSVLPTVLDAARVAP